MSHWLCLDQEADCELQYTPPCACCTEMPHLVGQLFSKLSTSFQIQLECKRTQKTNPLCVFIYVRVTCAAVWEGQRTTLGIAPQLQAILCWETPSVMDLELAEWARLAGWAPATCLELPSVGITSVRHWGQLFLNLSSRDWTQVSHFFSRYFPDCAYL